jgi:hypothetical protein
MALLFDRLVGEAEQRHRYRESERLGSFEIDGELVLVLAPGPASR